MLGYHPFTAGTPEMLKQATATMNLFPTSEKQADVSNRNMGTPPPPRTNFRSMDLFPQHSGGFKDDLLKQRADSRCALIYTFFFFLFF